MTVKRPALCKAYRVSAQGFPFANRLFFPYAGGTAPIELAYFKTINEQGDVPDDGSGLLSVNSGWVPGVSDFNETFATRSYVWYNTEDHTFVPYGTERYRKKEFHDCQLKKSRIKVAELARGIR